MKKAQPRTESAERPQGAECAGRFDWMPDAWVCGTSDQVCRHCGRAVIFATACIGIEACACGAASKETATFSVRGNPATRIGASKATSAG